MRIISLHCSPHLDCLRISILRKIQAARANTSIRVKETPSAVSLSLRPLVPRRRHHAIVKVANVRNFEGGFELLEMCEKEEKEEESLLKKMRR